MKILIAFPLLLSIFQLKAQKNIDGLVDAEKSFAAYSVTHGAKNAFLKFIDSNGIVFDQGKAANGIEVWKKRQDGPFILNWTPYYAEISNSNDFGYTTGPWMLHPNNNDSITARGRFTTVWHLNANGEWKFLVDLGVGNTPELLQPDLNQIKTKKISGTASTNNLLKTEQNFIELYKAEKANAYQVYLSNQSILNRNRFQPATEKKGQADMIIATPSDIEFTITGSQIAQTGDLAFIYGDTSHNNKTENYLRIWRKEKDGWRIAVEVLRY